MEEAYRYFSSHQVATPDVSTVFKIPTSAMALRLGNIL
uniref:Uncharacterized protein n=1 Tax=Siphoviridae sp. ctqPo10 TaxID=2827948 RepID=A0A8S5SUZ9_9CAUD|nr:MAG TPA: hypothetical protein [Siphoviridae sp. ctqPo10]